MNKEEAANRIINIERTLPHCRTKEDIKNYQALEMALYELTRPPMDTSNLYWKGAEDLLKALEKVAKMTFREREEIFHSLSPTLPDIIIYRDAKEILEKVNKFEKTIDWDKIEVNKVR